MGPRRVLAYALVAPGILATTALAQELIITGTDGNDELDGIAAGQDVDSGRTVRLPLPARISGATVARS
jgi:hypothetical protein